jgi:uncharacterized membrane protein (UPF0182 family)
MTWIERWLKRRNEIAQGADADLLAQNARRFHLAAVLFIAAVVLFWITTKLPLPHTARVVLNIIVFAAFVASLVLAHWTQRMEAFLNRPDPEAPPSILKK